MLLQAAEQGQRHDGRNPDGRRGRSESHAATPIPPTLSEIGLPKSESSRYQQLAAMPSDHFEAAVATAGPLPEVRRSQEPRSAMC